MTIPWSSDEGITSFCFWGYFFVKKTGYRDQERVFCPSIKERSCGPVRTCSSVHCMSLFIDAICGFYGKSFRIDSGEMVRCSQDLDRCDFE